MPLPDDCDPIQDAKHARETAAARSNPVTELIDELARAKRMSETPTLERLTPADALTLYEAADARKKAALREQAAADAVWVKAAEELAKAIDAATAGNHRCPVMIGGKLVTVEWDFFWIVKVQTPPVLG